MVREWALNHGWAASEAQELSKLAPLTDRQLVTSGVVRTGRMSSCLSFRDTASLLGSPVALVRSCSALLAHVPANFLPLHACGHACRAGRRWWRSCRVGTRTAGRSPSSTATTAGASLLCTWRCCRAASTQVTLAYMGWGNFRHQSGRMAGW